MQQQQPLFMTGNYRPLKPLNGRLLRTNINIKYKVKTKKIYFMQFCNFRVV